MASSHHITRPRALLASTATSLRRAPILLSTVPPQSPLRSPCLHSAFRNFWWSRNGYTNKSCSSREKYHKFLEAYQRNVKYRSGKGLQHIPPWCKDDPLNQYRPSQGWRSSSSWGKSNGGLPGSNRLSKDKGTGGEEKKPDWMTEFEKREGEIASRFEAWRKRMDEDPYEMLFGRASERGLWNPFARFESAWPSSRLGSTQRNESNQRTQEEPKASSSEEGTLHKGKVKDSSACNQADPSPHLSPTVASGRRTGESPQSLINESSEDYVIDPISMRKVPRRHIDPVPKSTTGNSNQSINIPVKKYVQPKLENANTTSSSRDAKSSLLARSSESETLSSATKSKASPPIYRSIHPWLDREGFGVQADSPGIAVLATAAEDPKSEHVATNSQRKIESSLDRHLRAAYEPKQEIITASPQLEYKTDENKTEDVDLLRASDVRARSGQMKITDRGLQEAKGERRRKLDEAFEKRLRTSDLEDVENLAIQKATQLARRSRIQAESTISKLEPALEESYLNKVDTYDSPVTNVDFWGYDLTPRNGLGTSREETLENEIQTKENSYAHVQQQIMNHQLPEDIITSYEHLHQGREEQRLIESTDQVSQEEIDQIQQDQYLEIERQNKKRLLRIAAQARLAQEVDTQKAAMNHIEYSGHNYPQAAQPTSTSQLGEGDLPENVHEFAGRDRWYKKKALHATERDSQLYEQRSQEVAKEHPLVREIKDIYEDAYGAIDVNHRQAVPHPSMEGKEDPAVQRGLQEYDDLHATFKSPSIFDHTNDHTIYPMFNQLATNNKPIPDGKGNCPHSTMKQIETPITPEPMRPIAQQPAQISVASTPSRNIYKILALHHSTHEVTSVTTTSSLHEQSSLPRSASAILSHLSHPANFIPHLEALEGTDFELIAGNWNMLLYKKMNKGDGFDHSVEAAKKDVKPANVPSSTQKTTMANPAGGDAIDSITTFEELERTDRQAVNPIDGTTGRFASPTGFVNHDAVLPSFESSEPVKTQNTRPLPGETVKREEDVFSGSQRHQWAEEEPRGRTDKRSTKKSNRGSEKASWSSRFFRTLKGVFMSMLVYGSIFSFIYAIGYWMSHRRERQAVRESRDPKTGKEKRENPLTQYGTARTWRERE